VNVTFRKSTVDEFTSAPMLEFPFPSESVPVASAAVNPMFSICELTPFIVSAGPCALDVIDALPSGDATAHTPPAQVSPP
jgi:hypothetical protein